MDRREQHPIPAQSGLVTAKLCEMACDTERSFISILHTVALQLPTQTFKNSLLDVLGRPYSGSRLCWRRDAILVTDRVFCEEVAILHSFAVTRSTTLG